MVTGWMDLEDLRYVAAVESTGVADAFNTEGRGENELKVMPRWMRFL